MRLLGDAQRSKHLMLLHAIAEAAAGDEAGGGTGGETAPVGFRAGYDLVALIQAAAPEAAAWLLSLPHLGGWVHDTLIHLEQGTPADFDHFACLAAAAAIRAGLPFDLCVRARAGRLRLPGLGSLQVAGETPVIRLCSEGERVTAGDWFAGDRRLLVPDDGDSAAVPGWSGTPVVQAAADGLTWTVLLETGDPYLDRYPLPMRAAMPAAELADWRQRVQSAWRILAGRHRWAAEPMSDVVSVIVPLTPHSETDLVSATTPAAYGAIATSWPPDDVTLAETLVHEFQHVKLGGLLDMVPLAEAGEQKVYAPWRQDPRPAGGLLQGIYAHLGIVRFWQAQQHAEADRDGLLRAQVQFARWGQAVGQATQTLLDTGSLTPDGVRFAGLVKARGDRLMATPVSGEAAAIAAEAALDHWLTWQLRHVAADGAGVAELAAAYQRGEPFPGPARTWVQADTRKVDSGLRSRLLNLRYLDPPRYRELCADGVLPVSAPDRLLLDQRSEDAVGSYRTRIADSGDPQPEAWIGLALALRQLAPSPWPATLATGLVLMFETYARLPGRQDPLDLASWFT
ncbi:MAG: HEXXH motif domain-containing protein [Streptosporangiaceae bacterium]